MRDHARPTLVDAAPGAPDHSRSDTVALAAAVDAGLRSLRNLALVDSVIAAGEVEDRLYTALSTTHPEAPGRVAARIACAHLAAGSLTDAYFALLTARDQLWEPREEQYRELLTPRRHSAPPQAASSVGGPRGSEESTARRRPSAARSSQPTVVPAGRSGGAATRAHSQ